MTSEEIQFFDRMSGTWDEHESLSVPEKVKSVLSLAGVSTGMEILDLGTGTGVLLPFLSELVGKEGRILAVDISEGMLDRARNKFSNLENIAFTKLDFEEEVIEGKYDLIMLYCVYPHLHNPEATLKKLKKSNLKPGGRIIIAFPSDETFVNNIHKEKKAESKLLPSAPDLSERFTRWDMDSSVISYSPDIYMVEIRS